MGLFKRQLPTPGLCRLDNCNNSERSSSRRFIKTNEAPYQTLGKRTLAATLGFNEIYSSHFWLSLLSECLSCYLYVFIVCSTRISWTGAIIGHEPNLLAMSISSGITMMLLIFTFRTVHVNPALTVSFLLTGRIPVFRALLYVIVHCVGAVAAIAFLYSISIKGHAGALGLDNPHDKLLSWQILIVEIVISFVVTLATYATCNYSSYTNAKKHILDQLGEPSSLFPNNELNGQRHSRRTVAPIVPQLPSASITLLHGQRADLMGGPSGHNNNNEQTNNNPYLISNHYNQVYDEYCDVMGTRNMHTNVEMDGATEQMNPRANYSNDEFCSKPFNSRTTKNPSHIPTPFSNNNHTISGTHLGGNNNPPSSMSSNDNKRNLLIDSSHTDDSEDARFLTRVGDNGYSNCSNNPTSNSSGGSNNVSVGLTKALIKPTEYYSHNTSNMQPNFRSSTQARGSMLNSYQDDANYDYDYDNHRIYATQQLQSEASPQIPIEEVMQDECQLLAPNGFSLRVTSGQAFVIGMAYTLTSLSGIPASGASLNPARSFGPAFIMNRWDSHWIYWIGPILGAVIAGFFYEFIFSPTRKTSLCYRPKLFRLSALDIAKVGSKSRLYQHHHQQQQKMSNMITNRTGPTTATTYRPQSYHHQQIHQSPTTRTGAVSNLITNSSLSKSFRDPQLITAAASVAHLQSPYPNTFDQMSYMTQHQQHQSSHLQQQQQQQQVHDRPQTANFDRSKSTAILNSISALQHQSSINLNHNRNNADLGKFIGESRMDPPTFSFATTTKPSFSEL